MSIAQSCMKQATGEANENSIDVYKPPKQGKGKRKGENAAATPKKPVVQKKNNHITIEVQQAICEAISQGQSLSSFCTLNNITQSCVYALLARDANFAENYAQARERQADVYADEIIALADGCVGTMEDTNRVRLQIDARKWACGKLHPKKYSDKAAVELTGRDGGAVMVAPAPIIEFSSEDNE